MNTLAFNRRKIFTTKEGVVIVLSKLVSRPVGKPSDCRDFRWQGKSWTCQGSSNPEELDNGLEIPRTPTVAMAPNSTWGD